VFQHFSLLVLGPSRSGMASHEVLQPAHFSSSLYVHVSKFLADVKAFMSFPFFYWGAAVSANKS
jgi:hypothetical protein